MTEELDLNIKQGRVVMSSTQELVGECNRVVAILVKNGYSKPTPELAIVLFMIMRQILGDITEEDMHKNIENIYRSVIDQLTIIPLINKDKEERKVKE